MQKQGIFELFLGDFLPFLRGGFISGFWGFFYGAWCRVVRGFFGRVGGCQVGSFSTDLSPARGEDVTM